MALMNLFASTLTDPMMDFLASFREGRYRFLAGIRALEEDHVIRCHLNMPDEPHAIIFFEITDLLSPQDIGWVYEHFAVGTTTPAKKDTFTYAVNRALDPQNKLGGYAHMCNDDDFAKAKAFRDQLEIPILALRYLKKHYDPSGMVDVKREGNIVAVLFDEK